MKPGSLLRNLCDHYILLVLQEGFCIYHFYMGTPDHKEYAAFEEKVRRTIYIDNLSPQVTGAVLKTALGQFGTVTDVQFIPNYTEFRSIPQCTLVEMETAKQAKSIVTEMTNYPFMMSGMPRPVRARPAEVEMFSDRPPKPGRKIHCRWVDPNDPDFEVAKKLKFLTRKHAAEASFILKCMDTFAIPLCSLHRNLQLHWTVDTFGTIVLILQLQLEEEEKLAKQQAESLKANYKKFEMIESVMLDGTAGRLARHYGLSAMDD
ncbi:hypothetical protein HHK36_007833 [Tetracentron sinense]|uniref:RRM domain-containing protein n=1 Tax=Tetracentron sinense TaxID=13715 RepID=A0A834ZLA4_TETSI|nr:hypothetical protein HHK36_007833 [Tetracentron sinense]